MTLILMRDNQNFKWVLTSRNIVVDQNDYIFVTEGTSSNLVQLSNETLEEVMWIDFPLNFNGFPSMASCLSVDKEGILIGISVKFEQKMWWKKTRSCVSGPPIIEEILGLVR